MTWGARGAFAALAAALLLGAATATAAPAPPSPEDAADPEVAALSTEFNFGHFGAVLNRANARLDRGSLSDADLGALHRLAALSAFNIGRKEQAERHFEAALRLDPDFALDPFSVPPPAIALLERLRQGMAAELKQVREERRLRALRVKQEAEERALSLREQEIERRRVEDLTRRTLTRVDHHPYVLNFVPFGVGQFDEGRPGFGVAFAVSESILAGASAVAFWVYQLQILQTTTYTFGDRLPPNNTVTLTGVPASQAASARFWTTVKVSTGVGFYALYAAGVVDALLHYQEQTVTTLVREPAAAPAPLKPRASLLLVPGGAGVSLTLHF